MIIIFFIFGSIIGSFLGVCVERLNRGETIIRGRSHCDSCNHLLTYLDLIPLLSFILLRAKCRYCKHHISITNFLIELVAGIAGLVSYLYFGSSLNTFLLFLILSVLIVIFFSDLKFGIIPDEAIIVGSLVMLIINWINWSANSSNWINSLVSAFAAAGFFLIIYLFTHGRGIGFGDVKLGLFMGLFLGFPKIIIAIYFSYILGTIIILPLLLLKKKSLHDTISFGPFLIIGTICAYFLPEKILPMATLFLR